VFVHVGLSRALVAETEKYRDRRDTCHVTMTSLNDVIESLDYVINIDSSPFTLSLSTGNVTHHTSVTSHSDTTYYRVIRQQILIVNYMQKMAIAMHCNLKAARRRAPVVLRCFSPNLYCAVQQKQSLRVSGQNSDVAIRFNNSDFLKKQ